MLTHFHIAAELDKVLLRLVGMSVSISGLVLNPRIGEKQIFYEQIVL